MSAPLLIGIYVLILVGVIIIFFIVYSFEIHRKKLKAYYQQELLRTKLEIQEQTFKTVSHEIHDNIGQLLSLAKLNLNRINTTNLGADELKLQDAKAMISKTIIDLRNLSRTLDAENIENIGLVKAIETELQLLQNADSKEVQLIVEGTVARLDAQKELFLYRIFQEALHNILKHADASFIQVKVIYKEKSLAFVISDNGSGFDSIHENHKGSGMRNMRSRAKLIGAHFEIISTLETGTSVHIYLPIID